MIDEYNRLNSPTDSNKSNRLRLFLFPVKPAPGGGGRRFSVSLQEPLFNFKISPETTFGWLGHSPAPSDEMHVI
ncbi:hypothetical protein Hanom_Chr11g01009721 [Helianthus anomalus]